VCRAGQVKNVAVGIERRNRRVMRSKDLTDDQMALIAEAAPPSDDARFDAELTSWDR
jgi:hypothetical protein